MKAASLALACALLGATALASASFAQTPPGAPQTPAEASPSTSSPDAGARTGTPEQRDWRDQMGRDGGWSRTRDSSRDSSRDMRQSYAGDDDDDDDDMPMRRSGGRDDRGPQQAGRGDEGHGPGHGAGAGPGPRGMKKMDPELMRMHMRMMGGQEHGAHLKLKRGDSEMDIHCPGNENITACVEAVGKLMDRLQAMPQTPR